MTALVLCILQSISMGMVSLDWDEHAQAMAAHESPYTTKLYDRTKERLTQDEVERIRL
jgi:hypothetical protein